MSAPGVEGSFRGRAPRVVVVTQVAESRSSDLNRRTRNYVIAMAIRVACFGLLFVVPGWWRLAPLAGAMVLPMVAVMFVNAIDHRAPEPLPSDDGPLLALGSGEVIRGEVVQDDALSADD